MQIDLPRLAYLADVPLEKSGAGMLLMYRLFEQYPPEKLYVLETVASRAALRLPNVGYQPVYPRLFQSRGKRLRKLITVLLCLAPAVLARMLAARAKAARVQGVVTISHGTSWMLAAALAARLRVPLYLINHDYWMALVGAPKILHGRLEHRFGEVYRSAAHRFCISPYMEAYYFSQYGAHAHLLYPGRAADAEFKPVPGMPSPQFRMAYAGSLHGGPIPILRAVAGCLAEVGGTLAIYCEVPPARLRELGLQDANIHLGGHIASEDLIRRLHASADALIVPMPDSMGVNRRVSFPSKLADYTATGLPVVIIGPRDCSAARWARENDVGVVVDEGDRDALMACIRTLAADPALRDVLGQRLREVGSRYFSYECTAGVFMRALTATADVDDTGVKPAPA